LSPRPNEKAFKIIYPDNYGNYNTKADAVSYVKKLSNARQINIVKQTISELIKKEDFSVLDVGCGDGSFLDKIKYAFPTAQTFGIEPDHLAAKIANENHEIYNGFIEDFSTDKKYDIIVTSHVIEHVADPVLFLDNLRSLLAKGGKIIVDTPNIACLQSKIFRRHWGGIHAPRHWTLFDKSTAIQCAEHAKLKVISVKDMPLNIFWIWSIHSLLYSVKITKSFADRYFNTRDVLSRKSLYYLSLVIAAESLEQFAGMFRMGQGQLRMILEEKEI
jgi:SAM-dependent methyltransferase